MIRPLIIHHIWLVQFYKLDNKTSIAVWSEHSVVSYKDVTVAVTVEEWLSAWK